MEVLDKQGVWYCCSDCQTLTMLQESGGKPRRVMVPWVLHRQVSVHLMIPS